MTTRTIANLETIAILARIAQKPGTSKRDLLTIARHVLRRACAYRETIHEVRRKANKLRQFEPFTKQQVADFEQLARDYGADLLSVNPVEREQARAKGQTVWPG